MVRISFTKFLEFTASTGETKGETALSAYRQSNTPYDPIRDFHKRVRQAIVVAERQGSIPDWEPFISAQSSRKQANFEDTLQKHQNWRGGFEQIEWFEPPKSNWNGTEFYVTVNPELGLILDGAPFAIKLFFNRKRLSAQRAMAGGLMMQQALSSAAPEGCRYAILDIKAEQFHTFEGASEAFQYALIGEEAHLSAIINAVRDAA